jgi:hypothetical protein
LLAAEQVLHNVGKPRSLARLPRPPGGVSAFIHRLQRNRAPLDPPP